MPGPVCYGRGGTEPTVTDANLLLGRLDAEHFLGGETASSTSTAASASDASSASPSRWDWIRPRRPTASCASR